MESKPTTAMDAPGMNKEVSDVLSKKGQNIHMDDLLGIAGGMNPNTEGKGVKIIYTDGFVTPELINEMVNNNKNNPETKILYAFGDNDRDYENAVAVEKGEAPSRNTREGEGGQAKPLAGVPLADLNEVAVGVVTVSKDDRPMIGTMSGKQFGSLLEQNQQSMNRLSDMVQNSAAENIIIIVPAVIEKGQVTDINMGTGEAKKYFNKNQQGNLSAQLSNSFSNLEAAVSDLNQSRLEMREAEVSTPAPSKVAAPDLPPPPPPLTEAEVIAATRERQNIIGEQRSVDAQVERALQGLETAVNSPALEGVAKQRDFSELKPLDPAPARPLDLPEPDSERKTSGTAIGAIIAQSAPDYPFEYRITVNQNAINDLTKIDNALIAKSDEFKQVTESLDNSNISKAFNKISTMTGVDAQILQLNAQGPGRVLDGDIKTEIYSEIIVDNANKRVAATNDAMEIIKEQVGKLERLEEQRPKSFIDKLTDNLKDTLGVGQTFQAQYDKIVSDTLQSLAAIEKDVGPESIKKQYQALEDTAVREKMEQKQTAVPSPELQTAAAVTIDIQGQTPPSEPVVGNQGRRNIIGEHRSVDVQVEKALQGLENTTSSPALDSSGNTSKQVTSPSEEKKTGYAGLIQRMEKAGVGADGLITSEKDGVRMSPEQFEQFKKDVINLEKGVESTIQHDSFKQGNKQLISQVSSSITSATSESKKIDALLEKQETPKDLQGQQARTEQILKAVQESNVLVGTIVDKLDDIKITQNAKNEILQETLEKRSPLTKLLDAIKEATGIGKTTAEKASENFDKSIANSTKVIADETAKFKDKTGIVSSGQERPRTQESTELSAAPTPQAVEAKNSNIMSDFDKMLSDLNTKSADDLLGPKPVSLDDSFKKMESDMQKANNNLEGLESQPDWKKTLEPMGATPERQALMGAHRQVDLSAFITDIKEASPAEIGGQPQNKEPHFVADLQTKSNQKATGHADSDHGGGHGGR